VAVSLNACEWRDFHDELREVKKHVRSFLDEARPTKGASAQCIARHFETAIGVHGGGYAPAPTGFGVRWHYRCGVCQGRTQQVFRPFWSERWACRRCSGVGRIRRDRGCRWGELLVPLMQELAMYGGRPGRLPVRYYRLMQRLNAIVTAGHLMLP
jgi:hypothetical protein